MEKPTLSDLIWFLGFGLVVLMIFALWPGPSTDFTEEPTVNSCDIVTDWIDDDWQRCCRKYDWMCER